jgi:hypothetical protein
MFTLLTTIVSFLSGGIPRILDFFQDRNDKKHELDMANLQFTRELELQKAGLQSQEHIEEIRLDGIQVQTAASEREALYAHDVEIGKGASTWVINARALVRPAITFGLFSLLAFVEIYGFYYAWASGSTFEVVMETLWDDEMQTVWASVVAFHFGTRAFGK